MKKSVLWLLVALLFCQMTLVAQTKEVTVSGPLPQHPRLLLLKGEEGRLKKQIRKDRVWTEIHEALLQEATSIVPLPVNERIQIGRRLLSVSRENLRRIFLLSYAYRMTGKRQFLNRAEAEMLQAASFTDWNPSHFLDVGEMTLALAIGYDWLYTHLSSATREAVEQAILEKGLKPSFCKEYNKFVTVTHNWNQVCHAGMSYGALAIWEKAPALAEQVLHRAIEHIVLPMERYAPDGVYPEGVSYWEYGTTFNALLISALEKIFHTDFGLSEQPGFLKTGEYVLHAVTPGLKNYAYSDNSPRAFLSPAMFWFYDKTRKSEILYNQARIYQKEGTTRICRDRLAPAILIWGASASMHAMREPSSLIWKGQGDNPVCFMRSSWKDSTALFAGFKLGSPSVNHGHMDVGSFLVEKDGLVWAMDLGAEEYNRLESMGVDLWNRSQGSQRWDVFRYTNRAHNTLTFNRKGQVVKGKAQIDAFSDREEHMYAVSDLTSVYAGQVKAAKRALSLVDTSYVVVEDLIETTQFYTQLRWTMVTAATPHVVAADLLCLEQAGKKFYIRVECPTPIRWQIEPAQSVFSFDSPNPGITLIGFETDLQRNTKQHIKVYLLPDEPKSVSPVSVL